MSPDLTTALGTLLADRTLRGSLRRDPGQVARRLGVDVRALEDLDPAELDRQAESLIEKRLHEVGKQLPRTVILLNHRGAGLFKQYADAHWPQGHHRHLRDAAAFGAFLSERGLPLCRSEWDRVRFLAGKRRMMLACAPDVWAAGRDRKALQVFLRFRGRVRSCAIYLGL